MVYILNGTGIVLGAVRGICHRCDIMLAGCGVIRRVFADCAVALLAVMLMLRMQVIMQDYMS
jgi:hypothetical protein